MLILVTRAPAWIRPGRGEASREWYRTPSGLANGDSGFPAGSGFGRSRRSSGADEGVVLAGRLLATGQEPPLNPVGRQPDIVPVLQHRPEVKLG